ncbi:hypothetical protein TRVL_03665 [Trypanosoma vivax]|nr:hypothetical protein TRVL_03665 [Trypanosoma vivax]
MQDRTETDRPDSMADNGGCRDADKSVEERGTEAFSDGKGVRQPGATGVGRTRATVAETGSENKADAETMGETNIEREAREKHSTRTALTGSKRKRKRARAVLARRRGGCALRCVNCLSGIERKTMLSALR